MTNLCGGNRSPHRVLMGRHRQHLLRVSAPTERQRKHGQQHSSRWHPISSSMLVRRVSPGWVAQTWPLPWPRGTGTFVSPLTNGLRFLLPERRGEPCDVGPLTLGTSAPSIVWLPPEQHNPHLPRVDEGTRRSVKEGDGRNRLWRNRLWPNRLWPNQLWPNRLLDV